MTPTLWIAAGDLHYPKVNWRTFRAMLKFIEDRKPTGFIFGGDQFDNECISHHTKGKPLLRSKAAYRRDEVGFERGILEPLEKSLGGHSKRVWVVGNHDNWESQLIEEQPELEGVLERTVRLRLKERGWEIVPIGRSYRQGKLTVIHGEVLGGFGNQVSQYHAKKAVEAYCSNVLYFHFHSPQSYTKVLPVNQTQKWMAHCAPILGDRNPGYLRNRPTAWLNGFVAIEFHGRAGNFNLYPIVVTEGRFSYGGKVYDGNE